MNMMGFYQCCGVMMVLAACGADPPATIEVLPGALVQAREGETVERLRSL